LPSGQVFCNYYFDGRMGTYWGFLDRVQKDRYLATNQLRGKFVALGAPRRVVTEAMVAGNTPGSGSRFSS
jgi:hypothetical protein